MIHKIPRNSYTYLVEGFFAAEHSTLRNQVLSRYTRFFQNLLRSPSKEDRLLANIVARDPQSTTFKNVKYIGKLALKSPWDYSALVIGKELPVQQVPDNQRWRIGFITKLMEMRKEKYLSVEDSARVSAWLDSLCST